MHPLDIVVLVAYFVIVVAAGFWFTRQSAAGLRSYFLGENKEKWWMLACSGSATNYSVDGTVWNISMLMVLGMASWYTTLVWWMPNPVILMVFSAIWIRRTGAMTAADLNTVRFGVDHGAQAARIGFAVLIVLFSVAQLCMSYVVLHKFAVVFGFDKDVVLGGVSIGGGHAVALLIVGATGLYVLFGGFRGVVLTDVIQNVLLVIVSFVIGGICFLQYDGPGLETALNHGTVTAEYWKSLAYKPHPDLGLFADSSYKNWSDFTGAALAFSLVGIIGCFGGAGGRYGEQRYLAAKNGKQAAWQAALWQALAIPRWVVTAGLAFLAFTYFREQTVLKADPDAVFPLFTSSALLGPGMRGLVLATLAAAYMSTFSAEVNAAASIVVHDIWQPFMEGDRENAKRNMVASYGATLLLVASCMMCGYFFVENSSLNKLWSWMLGGLITCVVVPLALRWYWGRMNGWGFAAGCIVGFVPSLLMLSKQFAAEDAWVQAIPDAWMTYAILGMSLLTCIIVSLLTKPVDTAHIDRFYCRVRPFGLWGGIRQRALASGEPVNAPLNLKFIPINLVVGLAASYSLYMTPVYFLGRWFCEAAVAGAIFLACVVVLYFTWFKTLPEE
jgi:SSS family solute:Na+ symporter